MLLYDHQHVIESCAGVQQGGPLGPLYFCCGINGLVNEIASLNPVYNKWYMDDGGIVGDVALLKKVWEILKVRGPALGLHLNPSRANGHGSIRSAHHLALSGLTMLRRKIKSSLFLTLRFRCSVCHLAMTPLSLCLAG